MPAKKSRTMSDEHKAALAEGREAGNAVRKYLEALEANQPKRGRKRTPESIQKRMEAIDLELAGASPIKRLNLLQEQSNLQEELEALNTAGDGPDLSELEDGFITHAWGYGEAKGISYKTWRAAGVPAEILKRAEISRGG